MAYKGRALKELRKRVLFLIGWESAKLGDNSYEVREFHEGGVSIYLRSDGTIEVMVDSPIMLLLHATAGITKVYHRRPDGYEPLLKVEHLEATLSALRATPLDEG